MQNEHKKAPKRTHIDVSELSCFRIIWSSTFGRRCRERVCFRINLFPDYLACFRIILLMRKRTILYMRHVHNVHKSGLQGVLVSGLFGAAILGPQTKHFVHAKRLKRVRWPHVLGTNSCLTGIAISLRTTCCPLDIILQQRKPTVSGQRLVDPTGAAPMAATHSLE